MTKVARVWKALFGSTESRPKVFVEPLESRQLLSGDAAGGVDAPIGTWTSLSSSVMEVAPGEQITLTARVSSIDSAAPRPTGAVAFLDLYAWDSSTWLDLPARKAFPAAILSVVPLADDGTATLTVDASSRRWPQVDPDSFVAVYLGRSQTIVSGCFYDSHTCALAVGKPEWYYASDYSPWLVITGGKAFRLDKQTITALGQPLPEATVLQPGENTWRYHTGTENTLPADFVTSAMAVRMDAFNNSVKISVLDAPDELTGRNPLFETSSATLSVQVLPPKRETGLVMRTLGHGTRTNPPVFTFSFTDHTGKSLSSNRDPYERGQYCSSTAGVIVSIPGSAPPGGGGWTGGGSSGGSGVVITRVPLVPYPTGSISLYDGDAYLWTASIVDGTAVFQPTSYSLGLGSHTIRAVYSGDLRYLSSSADATVEIAMTPTSVLLSPPAGPVARGASVPLNATVTTTVRELVAPSGPVHFYVDGALYATIPLGTTERVTWDLPVGLHQVHVVYGGSGDQLGATSDPVTLEVTPSTTQVATAATTVARRGIMRLPVAVSAGTSTRKARGWVTVLLNGKTVARKQSGGLLKLPSRLTRRSYVLELVYSGDDQTLASRSRYILRVGGKALRLVPADRK